MAPDAQKDFGLLSNEVRLALMTWPRCNTACMHHFLNGWSVLAAIAVIVGAVAGFVQTVLSILKSRYELRKLRAEDKKLFAKRRSDKGRELRTADVYGRSDYYYERLDIDLRSLFLWIVLTSFLVLSGLAYLYIGTKLVTNRAVIGEKRQQLSSLQQANRSLGEALVVLHAVKDQQFREKQKGSPFP